MAYLLSTNLINIRITNALKQRKVLFNKFERDTGVKSTLHIRQNIYRYAELFISLNNVKILIPGWMKSFTQTPCFRGRHHFLYSRVPNAEK